MRLLVLLALLSLVAAAPNCTQGSSSWIRFSEVESLFFAAYRLIATCSNYTIVNQIYVRQPQDDDYVPPLIECTREAHLTFDCHIRDNDNDDLVPDGYLFCEHAGNRGMFDYGVEEDWMLDDLCIFVMTRAEKRLQPAGEDTGLAYLVMTLLLLFL